MPTLIAVLFPAVAFVAGLLWLRGDARVPDVLALGTWPAQLWCVALGGIAATAGGVADWTYHRRGHRHVPPAEQRAELWALGLGGPLFVLLATASLATDPAPFLVPIVAVALAMAGLIAYDETRFHRACTRGETVLHRLLVFGNAGAFLAWTHWCFARGGASGHVP